MSSFGPRNEREKLVFAEEAFRIDVQHTICQVMNEKKISQEELAYRLGVTDERVSRILSSSCNINIRGIAKIFHVLGVKCCVTITDPEYECSFAAVRTR